jgi:hypothetical protein
MNCGISDAEWMDYLDQALPYRDRQRIDAHLRICSPCRVGLDGLRQVDHRLRIEFGLIGQSIDISPESQLLAGERLLTAIRESSPALAHDRLWRVRWVLALLCGSNTAARIIAAAEIQTEAAANSTAQKWPLFLRRLAFLTTEICGSYAGELIWAVGQ